MDKNDDIHPHGIQPATLDYDEKKDDVAAVGVYSAEKDPYTPGLLDVEDQVAQNDLGATAKDLEEVEGKLNRLTLERTRAILAQIHEIHANDQNFPAHILHEIEEFLHNDDIMENPEKHAELVREMKLEALLVTENSPYAEVRAVVDVDDDPNMPSLTFRVWVIGILFATIGSFINQFFYVRQPQISVTSDCGQLVAYPAGKLLEKILPTATFTLFGKRMSLNPGPFNKKEHMLITIMANVSFGNLYTGNIIFSQYLPNYFNQSYAASFGYQILIALGTNFCGYGLAGLVRRFLVYPSYCVWPGSLSTLALNKSFHTDVEAPVPGPFGRIYKWSRVKFFSVVFCVAFVWFWIPGYLFTALSTFSWISWIAPNNLNLSLITGFNSGLGINPLPSFDWAVATTLWNPLILPAFVTYNQLVGMLVGFFFIVGFYYSNVWHTAYLPINSNHTFDNTGSSFKIRKILNEKGLFDAEKYQQYSQPWMAAGNLVIYFWFFAIYTCTISYIGLFHWREVAVGFKSLWRSLRRRKATKEEEDEADLSDDIHTKLMRSYKEVPEWWYLIVLLVAMGCGMAGIGAYETYTTPAVVLFGIALALVFLVPIGLITGITGIQVTLNVLAELIGGSWTPGNALSMNFFKSYGYITTAQAVSFSQDLKLAHYIKIPPRETFAMQLVATLVGTLVNVGVINFQLNEVSGICTSEAAFKFTCPGISTFFTAAVFWGTIGPKKLFGPGGQYTALLIGFPVGFLMPFAVWALRKKWPRSTWLRQVHPVLLCGGPLNWAPYNLSYAIPALYLASASWIYVRKRYLAFWSKYNFVLAAALTTGTAISAIVLFFALAFPEVDIEWWGNTVVSAGCEGGGCTLKTLADGEYFGPAPGSLPT